MGTNTLNSVTNTDFTNISGFDYSVNPQDTDGTTGLNETEYQCNWSKWHGYYRQIPELQAVIDAKARWTIGKGFKTDEKTKKILDKIKGFGKDSFNTILHNAIRTFTICGDSYAEIVRDQAGRLINIKPLNPGSIKIIVDEWGIIKRYEQVSQIPNSKHNIKFMPKEIFHLSWNRIADEIHGISTIEKVENIILMRNEAMTDLKTVFHRYVKPIQIIPVDTDNTTEISTFKTKYENAYKNTETIIIPKDTVDIKNIKHISLPEFSSLDPLPWIETLKTYFIAAEGVPEVILGNAKGTTEASSKILYLAFQQMIEHNQLYLEEQIKLQLGLDLELEFPAAIDQDLKSDEQKDGSMKGEKKSEIKPTKEKI